MVTADWDTYRRAAWLEIRRQVHRDGRLPLLLEYTEESPRQSEAWLIAVHTDGPAQRLSVYRWDMRKAQEDMALVGLSCREPQICGWQRPLSATEAEALAGLCAGVRVGPAIREGMVLDGVSCGLVLQEAEPVLQLRWNACLAGAGLERLVEWLEVVRLRRFLRG